MGEALDKVKKDLGFEDKDTTAGGKKDVTKQLTLEQIIDQVEDIDARELLRAKARELRAQMDYRTNELEQRSVNLKSGRVDNKSGTASNGGNKAERWSVVSGKPVKDEDGEYETFAQAYKVADLEVRAAAASAADKNNPLVFFDFLEKRGVLKTGGNTTDDFAHSLATRYLDNIDVQLKASAAAKGNTPDEVTSLSKELSGLKEELQKVSDPIAVMTKARAIAESMREAGLIGGGTPGESIEALRERNRHSEELKRIEIDADYKDKVGNTFAELPERIGRGLASQVMNEEEGEGESNEPLSFTCAQEIEQCSQCGKTYNSGTGTCPDCNVALQSQPCGENIKVKPGANQIVCPKCKTVYTRGRGA
jgi:hypothetical protein